MSKSDKKAVRETQSINVFFENNQFLPLLYGERDAHLHRLEQALNVELVARGNRCMNKSRTGLRSPRPTSTPPSA
jgi:phosphate starvation-inducible protein PhoH